MKNPWPSMVYPVPVPCSWRSNRNHRVAATVLATIALDTPKPIADTIASRKQGVVREVPQKRTCRLYLLHKLVV